MNMNSQCSSAAAQVLRHGAQLAAGFCYTIVSMLYGPSPVAVRWLAMSFLQCVIGHVLLRLYACRDNVSCAARGSRPNCCT